jgi:hypothetical protein
MNWQVILQYQMPSWPSLLPHSCTIILQLERTSWYPSSKRKVNRPFLFYHHEVKPLYELHVTKNKKNKNKNYNKSNDFVYNCFYVFNHQVLYKFNSILSWIYIITETVH